MQEPATAPWGVRISVADWDKLKAGLEPQEMEDKWRIWATEDDHQSQSSGTVSIHFARSWTDIEHYILIVKPSDSVVTMEAITWDQKPNNIRISEETAKKETVLLSRYVLECEIDALPEYDAPV